VGTGSASREFLYVDAPRGIKLRPSYEGREPVNLGSGRRS
jgi:hypothetical protein